LDLGLPLAAYAACRCHQGPMDCQWTKEEFHLPLGFACTFGPNYLPNVGNMQMQMKRKGARPAAHGPQPTAHSGPAGDGAGAGRGGSGSGSKGQGARGAGGVGRCVVFLRFSSVLFMVFLSSSCRETAKKRNKINRRKKIIGKKPPPPSTFL
jgi:hypothetical protein